MALHWKAATQCRCLEVCAIAVGHWRWCMVMRDLPEGWMLTVPLPSPGVLSCRAASSPYSTHTLLTRCSAALTVLGFWVPGLRRKNTRNLFLSSEGDWPQNMPVSCAGLQSGSILVLRDGTRLCSHPEKRDMGTCQAVPCSHHHVCTLVAHTHLHMLP